MKTVFVVVVVQSLSGVWLFATPWTAARQASLSFTISWNLLKLMSIELVMPSSHLILCGPLLLLPSISPSMGSFLMSQLFTSGGQRIGASASASVFPMNIQGWFPLGLTGSISLLLGHYIWNTERETTDFIHYTTLFKLYKNLVE